jgi:hypothetical protein
MPPTKPSGTPKETPAQDTPKETSEQPETTPAEWEERRTKLLAKVPAPDKRPANIYGKLAQILGLIPIVEKKGRNDFHGYNYAKESDLVEVVRPLLSEYGIFFWWTTKSEERRPQLHREGITESLSVVWIVFKFIDANGDATEQQEMPAYGDDPGDKGIYKALTGAVKYALMKTFLIATGDDPEGDKATDRRSAAAEASTRVDVQRGGRQGAPQQLRPSERARVKREQAAAGEQPVADEPPPAGTVAQPGPGGRQAEANAPAERQLSELLRTMGVRASDEAIALIGKVAGVEIPVNAEDKAGSLASFLTEYKTDRQRFGKLIYDMRTKGPDILAAMRGAPGAAVPPLRAGAIEAAAAAAEAGGGPAEVLTAAMEAAEGVEPPDDAFEAGEPAV